MDQRQALSQKTKPRYAGGGQPLCLLAKKRTGVYSFPRTGNSQALETLAAERQVFPKDKHRYSAGTRPWQAPPDPAGSLAPGPPRGEQAAPSAHPWDGAGRRIRKCSRSPAVKAVFLNLELSSLYDPTPPGRWPACPVHCAAERKPGSASRAAKGPHPEGRVGSGGALAESYTRRRTYR